MLIDDTALGAVHKRRRQLGGGEGSKIGQDCRQIVLKNCRHGGGGCQKSGKNCRRRLWMVPNGSRLRMHKMEGPENYICLKIVIAIERSLIILHVTAVNQTSNLLYYTT